MEKLKTLSMPELKKLAKELDLKPEPSAKKDEIIELITGSFDEDTINSFIDELKLGKKEPTDEEIKQQKQKEKALKKRMRRVIVTPRNSEEARDSMLVTIVNERGVFSYPVPFGVEISLPEFVINKIKTMEYQKFVKAKVRNIGMVDKPVKERSYNIEYLD